MKNKFLLKLSILIAILFSQNNSAKAQWVTIPDANFVLFLQLNYPFCMLGDQMWSSCDEISTETFLNVTVIGINDLYGLQYFSNLNELDCSFNDITVLPELPNSLTKLSFEGNQLTFLPELPNSLIYLNCGNNQLTSLPELPSSIVDLELGFNQLTSIPELPDSLATLICDNNQLASLPELPDSLAILVCEWNQLTSLPELPNSLTMLVCYENELTSLPELPNSLTRLNCYGNEITSLPELPNSLTELDCQGNQLILLPELPNSLIKLDCGNNQLTILPELPDLLMEIYCRNNQLTTLPELPNALVEIYCSYNQLTTLPELPNSLLRIHCPYNQLINLPELPIFLEGLYCQMNQLTALPELGNLFSFDCSNNQISCFPVFSESIVNLEIENNPFTCLPNYTYSIYYNYLNYEYPLCQEGDFTSNPYNCESAKGIIGNIYKDVNVDCMNNSSDLPSQNIPIQLFDEFDNLIATYYSSTDGSYNFFQLSGTYKIEIDTVNKPYLINCPEIGTDNTVVLDEINSLADSIDFSVKCKPTEDFQIQSIYQTGIVFPGQPHQLNLSAGDILSWYNLNCASGTSGTVQINVTGSVAYTGTTDNVLIPDAIDGNNYTYNIADFGVIPLSSFGLLFLTDTTAQAGEEICVTATVTLNGVDNDTTNNTLTYCYAVVNSYDPNEKEVYPTSVLPGYEDYFTYTIHFQNTGNAPAINIKVQDTLSTNLDLSTFEITAYSHPNNTTLSGSLISFKFPNIWLPDSTSDLGGSKGFVQYRIKPLPNLPVGTQITNTAYIYFDFNAPIQTNTTESNFEIIQSLKTYSKGKVSVYPNPNNGIFHVSILQKNQNEKTMELTNLLGEKVWSQKTRSNTATIDINHLPKGLYILNITDTNNHCTERVVRN